MAHRKPTRIGILGAGFGGMYAYRNLHRVFHDRKDVELFIVNRTNYFLFTPLLHEVATGGLAPGHIVEAIRSQVDDCGTEFVMGEVERVDFSHKTVATSAGRFPYDYLLIALGAETNFYGVPGAKEYAFPLKTLEDAYDLKNRCIRIFEQASHMPEDSRQKEFLRFVIVGGGSTGVEVASELAELLYETFAKLYPSSLISNTTITLLQAGKELMPNFPESLRKRSLEELKRKGVDVRLNTRATKVGKRFVELGGSERIATNTTVWTAGIRPVSVAFDEEPERDSEGRLIAEPTLQLRGRPEVFAIGDIASVQGNGVLPALAQVAERESDTAAENIRLLLEGKRLGNFHYRSAGLLISLGRWRAAAELHVWNFKVVLWGRFAWWLYRTVHLVKLLSFSKKVRVAVDWTVNFFGPRDISQV